MVKECVMVWQGLSSNAASSHCDLICLFIRFRLWPREFLIASDRPDKCTWLGVVSSWQSLESKEFSEHTSFVASSTWSSILRKACSLSTRPWFSLGLLLLAGPPLQFLSTSSVAACCYIVWSWRTFFSPIPSFKSLTTPSWPCETSDFLVDWLAGRASACCI